MSFLGILVSLHYPIALPLIHEHILIHRNCDRIQGNKNDTRNKEERRFKINCTVVSTLPSKSKTGRDVCSILIETWFYISFMVSVWHVRR